MGLWKGFLWKRSASTALENTWEHNYAIPAFRFPKIDGEAGVCAVASKQMHLGGEQEQKWNLSKELIQLQRGVGEVNVVAQACPSSRRKMLNCLVGKHD